MTFMAVIGKRYQESGIEDLLVESSVYGSESVMKIMTGKDYNWGVRALKFPGGILSYTPSCHVMHLLNAILC